MTQQPDDTVILEISSSAASIIFAVLGKVCDRTGGDALEHAYDQMIVRGVRDSHLQVVVEPNPAYDPFENIERTFEGYDDSSGFWLDEYLIAVQHRPVGIQRP